MIVKFFYSTLGFLQLSSLLCLLLVRAQVVFVSLVVQDGFLCVAIVDHKLLEIIEAELAEPLILF